MKASTFHYTAQSRTNLSNRPIDLLEDSLTVCLAWDLKVRVFMKVLEGYCGGSDGSWDFLRR